MGIKPNNTMRIGSADKGNHHFQKKSVFYQVDTRGGKNTICKIVLYENIRRNPDIA
jgi:hypothetical protein